MNNALHDVLNLRPGEISARVALKTPAEMRKAMLQAAYYSAQIHRVFQIADHEGFTGEDRYTALAFYLALENERLTDRYLRRMMLEPLPPIVMKGA